MENKKKQNNYYPYIKLITILGMDIIIGKTKEKENKRKTKI